MVTADVEPVSTEDKVAWFAQHSPTKRPLWIIEDADGKTLGWLSFQSFYGRPAYDATAEVSIYIDEASRGKGIGKAALQYAIEAAPQLRIKTLLGIIFSHNHQSLKLFLNAGFSEWGLLPDIAILDGIERSVTIVGKKVGEEYL